MKKPLPLASREKWPVCNTLMDWTPGCHKVQGRLLKHAGKYPGANRFISKATQRWHRHGTAWWCCQSIRHNTINRKSIVNSHSSWIIHACHSSIHWGTKQKRGAEWTKSAPACIMHHHQISINQANSIIASTTKTTRWERAELNTTRPEQLLSDSSLIQSKLYCSWFIIDCNKFQPFFGIPYYTFWIL